MERRTRNPRGDGERLREDLVAAASELIDEGGESALTLRAAARAVGAAPQSVYLHFAGREDLLWAVLGRRFEEFAQFLDEAVVGVEGAARLRARCQAWCDFAQANRLRYLALFSRIQPQHHDLPAAAFPGGRLYAVFAADIAGCLTAGPASPGSGESRSTDSPIGRAATDLFGAIHGALILRWGLPSFPWPDLTDAVDRAVSAAVKYAAGDGTRAV